MRKGAELEKSVIKLFPHYEQRGVFCLQIHPRRLHDGKNVEKAPFDFLMYHKEKLTCFDAKQCQKDRWPGAPSHQIRALLDVKRNGGDGFFLVWFIAAGRLVRFTPEQAMKSCAPDDGERVSIDVLGILEKKNVD
jgi:penicillin-binding protein-related factor A (putative recombinase)